MLRSLDYRIYLAALISCAVVAPAVALLALTFYLAVGVMTDILGPQMRRSSRMWQFVFRTYVGGLVMFAALVRVPAISIIVALGRQEDTTARITGFAFLGLATIFAPSILLAQGSVLSCVAAVYVVIGVAILPLLDGVVLLQKVRWPTVSNWKDVLRGFIFTSAVMATMIGLGIAAAAYGQPWFSRHPLVVKVMLIIVASAIGLAVISGGARAVWRLFEDRRQLRVVTSSTAVTRGVIAADFARFRTAWYRLRYVEWLRDVQVYPSGAWPIKRPNHHDDRASAMLAQLDERWLGLEA